MSDTWKDWNGEAPDMLDDHSENMIIEIKGMQGVISVTGFYSAWSGFMRFDPEGNKHIEGVNVIRYKFDFNQ